MKIADKTKNTRLISLFLLGLVLFNFPLLSLFNKSIFLFGIPLLYVYLFFAWLLIILLVALITSDRLNRRIRTKNKHSE